MTGEHTVTRRTLLERTSRGAAALGAASLAACGPLQPGAGAPRAGTPAKVEFYFSGDLVTRDLFVTLKETYERQYPNYRLELLHADTELDKMLTLLQAGTPPDAYWNRVRTSQALMRRENTLVDLLPLMKRDKLDQKDFWPSAVKAYTYKGGYYGLPTSASSNAVYFNRAHFRAVGLPFPDQLDKQGRWNWDALVENARKLTRVDTASGQKLFGFLRPGGLVLTVMYMWQNGGTPFSEDRRQCLLSSKECVGAVQFLADLVRKHQVAPAIGEEGNPNYRTNFRVAMEQSGRFIMASLLPALQSASLDPGMVLAPKGPKTNTTRGDDLAASVLKATKALEAAWAYGKLWSSKEGQLIVLKSNRSYTARKSVARDQALLKQVLHPWEDGDLYFTGLERTEVFPVTPQFLEVQRTYARELDSAYKGEKTPRQAMDAACQEIQPLLSQPF